MGSRELLENLTAVTVKFWDDYSSTFLIELLAAIDNAVSDSTYFP